VGVIKEKMGTPYRRGYLEAGQRRGRLKNQVYGKKIGGGKKLALFEREVGIKARIRLRGSEHHHASPNQLLERREREEMKRKES